MPDWKPGSPAVPISCNRHPGWPAMSLGGRLCDFCHLHNFHDFCQTNCNFLSKTANRNMPVLPEQNASPDMGCATFRIFVSSKSVHSHLWRFNLGSDHNLARCECTHFDDTKILKVAHPISGLAFCSGKTGMLRFAIFLENLQFEWQKECKFVKSAPFPFPLLPCYSCRKGARSGYPGCCVVMGVVVP